MARGHHGGLRRLGPHAADERDQRPGGRKITNTRYRDRRRRGSGRRAAGRAHRGLHRERAPRPELWSGASTLRRQRVGWFRELQPTRGHGRRPAERSRRTPGTARHGHRRPLPPRGAQAPRRRGRAGGAGDRARARSTVEPDGREERRRRTRCSRPRGRTSASRCGCAHGSPGSTPRGRGTAAGGAAQARRGCRARGARLLLLGRARADRLSRASEIAANPEAVRGRRGSRSTIRSSTSSARECSPSCT